MTGERATVAKPPSLEMCDFILARVAERQALAEVATPGPWEAVVNVVGASIIRAGDPDRIVATGDEREDCMSPEDGRHVAYNSPARILDECEAHRNAVLIYMHMWTQAKAARPDSDMAGMIRNMYAGVALILFEVAQVDSEHPDFRPQWRP